MDTGFGSCIAPQKGSNVAFLGIEKHAIDIDISLPTEVCIFIVVVFFICAMGR